MRPFSKEDMLNKAKNLLSEGYTLSLVSDGEVITSQARGVRPLLDLFDTGRDFSAFSAADKVVGRGAAFLYILLGVRELYADVVSEPALEILQNGGARVAFSTLVPRILNRTGDGFCPIESCVSDVYSAEEAVKIIKKTLAELA